MICDPEREYASLVTALGGEVIRIAAGSPHHINALDTVEGYGEGENPVVDKSEFVMSLFEQLDRGGFPTVITQNVEYLLDSVLASTMLSNSEFIVMLNQAAADRQKLAELLNISREQMGYITNAEAGCGLLRYGSALVPFVNRFPRDTELYRLMTTKPGE